MSRADDLAVYLMAAGLFALAFYLLTRPLPV